MPRCREYKDETNIVHHGDLHDLGREAAVLLSSPSLDLMIIGRFSGS
jgi:hypothetical protein